MEKISRQFLLFGLMLLLCLSQPFISIAQTPSPTLEDNSVVKKIDGFPVVLDGETLFFVKQGVGAFSPEERANAIAHRISEIARDDSLELDNFKIEISKEDNLVYLSLENEVILTITPQDAQAYRENQEGLAKEVLTRIKNGIEQYRNDRKPERLLRNVISTIIATLILLISSLVIIRISGKIFPIVEKWIMNRIPALRIQSFEIISPQQIGIFCLRIFQFTRLFFLLFLFYTYLTYIFSLYPWTRAFGKSIFGYFLRTIDFILKGISSYLPNIIVIVTIIVITYYIIRSIRPFFTALERESLIIPGFYPDWAKPTYNLILILIIALAAVIVFPYLPGFNSPAFRGISVFLGLLFSLGSTSAIANVVGGIILIYTRSFQVGDRIQIGEVTGDVIEKTLLVVRLKTPTNKVITIPNSSLLSSNVINFSIASRELESPLILQTTITLGYDLPWRKVHETLIKSALATDYILKAPSPFVLQTSLDDFYISYQLNAYTDRPNLMMGIYSQLHQNIQDYCREGGIEIMSPHYRAVRDGNGITIPES
jgi:small-conductance mechanosensitive channel